MMLMTLLHSKLLLDTCRALYSVPVRNGV